MPSKQKIVVLVVSLVVFTIVPLAVVLPIVLRNSNAQQTSNTTETINQTVNSNLTTAETFVTSYLLSNETISSWSRNGTVFVGNDTSQWIICGVGPSSTLSLSISTPKAETHFINHENTVLKISYRRNGEISVHVTPIVCLPHDKIFHTALHNLPSVPSTSGEQNQLDGKDSIDDMYSPWTTSMPCLFAGSNPNSSYKSHTCLYNSSATLDLFNPAASASLQSLNNSPYYHDQTYELKSNYFEPLPFFEAPHACKQKPLPQLSQKHTLIKQMIASTTHRSYAVTHGKKRPICTFCKSNGESASVYTSHVLRSANHEIQCPVLLAYVCPKCGATGKSAHTIKYCTALSEGERVALPTVKLFREGRSSSGNKNLFKKS